MDERRVARVPEPVKWLEEEIERSARLAPEDIEQARHESRRVRAKPYRLPEPEDEDGQTH